MDRRTVQANRSGRTHGDDRPDGRHGSARPTLDRWGLLALALLLFAYAGRTLRKPN